MSNEVHKVYLGDGVYAEHEGFQIRLYASDGMRVTNELWIEHNALVQLVSWARELGWPVK